MVCSTTSLLTFSLTNLHDSDLRRGQQDSRYFNGLEGGLLSDATMNKTACDLYTFNFLLDTSMQRRKQKHCKPLITYSSYPPRSILPLLSCPSHDLNLFHPLALVILFAISRVQRTDTLIHVYACLRILSYMLLTIPTSVQGGSTPHPFVLGSKRARTVPLGPLSSKWLRMREAP